MSQIHCFTFHEMKAHGKVEACLQLLKSSGMQEISLMSDLWFNYRVAFYASCQGSGRCTPIVNSMEACLTKFCLITAFSCLWDLLALVVSKACLRRCLIGLDLLQWQLDAIVLIQQQVSTRLDCSLVLARCPYWLHVVLQCQEALQDSFS